ncbi:hypothetical protein BDN70DRAFT_988274 [Pholiota conissans]|uniref:BSD domain-containing protein n=1 Tax=Pholiota conissans TaxID=109636 RepID=A0A9P6CZ33_9AGAR|nr:hypothetical protein BDN70DRAFT_988274 [Pholiota conissans]
MNFLDTFDIAPRAATPNPADPPPPPAPSLNEEVNEVIGQLGRFWGGFRKQSQTALEAARKDLGEVVVQAQKELAKFTATEETAETSAEGSGASATGTTTTTTEKDGAVEGASAAVGSSTATDGTAESTAAPESSSEPTQTQTQESTSTTQHTRTPSLTSQSLFARLQSALPSAVVQTVQTNLASVQTNFAQAQTNLQTNFAQVQTNFAQAQTNLQTNFAQVQTNFAQAQTNLQSNLAQVQENLTHTDLARLRVQAEELAQRGEARLRDAVREAGDVLRDAVKVVPPEEADTDGSGVPLLGSTPGLAWDGADMWMLPSAEGSRRASTSSRHGGSSGGGTGSSLETQSAVATRAEALLRRLAREPDIVRHDPEAEEGVRERYHAWRAAEVDANEGGVEGVDWTARIEKAREDAVDGAAVTELEANLVPSEMTKDVFWLRYFFRTHQIRAEEEKRKALLQSTADTDEDFSWEDDDDEADLSPKQPSTTTKAAPSISASTQSKLDVPAGATSSHTPRVGSADSFDILSATSSVAGDSPIAVAAVQKDSKKAEEEDGDSDWE